VETACPTSANISPARFVFIRSTAAKERLRPSLAPGNVEKTMAAAVTVIIAYDLKFYDKLPRIASLVATHGGPRPGCESASHCRAAARPARQRTSQSDGIGLADVRSLLVEVLAVCFQRIPGGSSANLPLPD